MSEQEDDIVRLTKAPNPAAAHVWRQALEDEGIRCQVVGDYLEAGLGDLPGLGPELWVHRDDLARAVEVLRRPPPADDGTTEAAEE